jgi:nucleoside-diphosphate-sugar epimerase
VSAVGETRGLALLTGATGFVGRACVPSLEGAGWMVRCAVRGGKPSFATAGDQYALGSIGADTDWSRALQGVNAVIHLAARVHVMRDAAADPLEAFRTVNVEGTRRLARQAAAAGVRRFIFVSSVKVNGEATAAGAFTENDPPHPQDPYGISKYEAEQALLEISARTGLEAVVIRPPLVYGPGVKANFLRMLRWVYRGIPLPLGSVHNRRSLLYAGNLADVIVKCLEHPAAAGETFLVDDGEPVSTAQLVREIGDALHRPARLLPIPPRFLRVAAAMFGRGEDAERLVGNLVVDSSRVRRTLGWSPPHSREDGLAATAAWFRAERR